MTGARYIRLLAIFLALVLVACDSQNPPTPRPSGTPTPSANPTTTVPTDSASPGVTPSASPSDSPGPTRTPKRRVEVTKTIPYATTGDCGERVTECQQFVDVYAPNGGGPYPVVVMVHGRPRTPVDMVELAEAVAERGVVVFNIDYRGVRPVIQKGWPYAVEDVACAVRFAHATAGAYGGDASHLILVGHSFGGYVGTLVSLDGDDFHGDCLYPDESALPSAWVGISANCLVGVPPPPAPLWTTWYGGDQDEVPEVWDKGDPLEHIGENPGLVVRMVHERDDPIVTVEQPRELVKALNRAGYDASLTIIDGDSHWGPLDLQRHAGEVTFDTIIDLLDFG